MTDKFKNYVDNIQENDIKSLIISPLIVLVIAQILSIFLEMASFFITTFTSRIMYNPTDYDTLISGTSFPSLVVYTLLLLAIIFLVGGLLAGALSSFTFGIVAIGYAIFIALKYNQMYAKNLIEKGWRPVSDTDKQLLTSNGVTMHND